MARSLNKATLIGNLTRDPELRYTPQGTAVCTFGVATNRQWTTESGEKKEDVEFHRVVAWNKLAELCSQLLGKGKKVYVEGRLQTRNWTGKDEVKRSTTEVVINEMIILDSKRGAAPAGDAGDFDIPEEKIDAGSTETGGDTAKAEKVTATKKSKPSPKKQDKQDDVESEDIPF